MRKNQGFTLIELMIVIAIIAIIAAIAIPNMLQSRMRANESAALTCIKNYSTGQITFETGAQYQLGANTNSAFRNAQGQRIIYCDNFANLFYGEERSQAAGGGAVVGSGRTLNLISQAFADANGLPTVGTGVNNAVVAQTRGGTPYQGYLFTEPNVDLAAEYGTYNDAFVVNYALMGAPVVAGSSGNQIYYIDSEGTALRRAADAAGKASAAASLAYTSPLVSAERAKAELWF